MAAPLLSAWSSHHPLVLLVDRDPDTRHMYSEYLKLSAYDIEEAEDGREALAKAITRHPKVIITETRLPGITGFDLCVLLRRDASTREIPIIVVTADAFAGDVGRAESMGADAVLVKPCLPNALLSEIHRLLGETADARERTRDLRPRSQEPVPGASPLGDRPAMQRKRVMLSRAHVRQDTIQPPVAPPTLLCPQCDQQLAYQRSHVGGVSARHAEQWDYYECVSGCGRFQYRQRTKKLRKV